MVLKFILFYACWMTITKSHGKNCYSTFKHTITIQEDGYDEQDCLFNSSRVCRTLDFVLREMMNSSISSTSFLRNSTKVEIKGQQNMTENHNLTKLAEFALCGQVNYQNNTIECGSGKGLIIKSSTGITIEHLSFHKCGSIQLSRDHLRVLFHTGIHLENTVDVMINHCNIYDSTGIGMSLFDVGGHVTLSYVVFSGNIKRNLTNTAKLSSKLAEVAGGLIVELTYGLQPCHSSNNVYHIHHCMFMENGCTWSDQVNLDMTGNKSVVFGCGGGMGMHLKGHASNNTVIVEHCQLMDNLADWGGGYYFLFQDETRNNSVNFNNVTLKSNHARLAGGGGRFGFFPHIKFKDLLAIYPNYFKHVDCIYVNNSASWGGGVSIYGSTEFPQKSPIDSNLSFTNCHWHKNQAIVGSALGLLSLWIDPQQMIWQKSGHGLAYIIELFNCSFERNIISHTYQQFGKSVVGTGTIYSDIAPLMMWNVSFSFNNGTALVLDSSYTKVMYKVTFKYNNGTKGGAIALYGRSKIILDENSRLFFTSNRALLQGGAVFAFSQGPNLKAFEVKILDRSTCFFTFNNPHLSPEKWTARVYFNSNSAPELSGSSIYANTLQFCRNYGNISAALDWKPVFHYQRKDNNSENHDIVTDPVTVTTQSKSWVRFPGELFHPEIMVRDEKNQSVKGLLKISVRSPNGLVKFGDQISQYLYISGGKTAVPLSIESSVQTATYSVDIRSVYTQVLRTSVENITVMRCYGGYKFDQQKKKCVCPARNEMPYGYSRCEGNGKTIFLKIGYWAETNKDGHLQVSLCPKGYCKCSNKQEENNSYAKDECTFEKFNNESKQCTENRQGRLCGSCKSGFSVVVGKQDCKKCRNIGILWLIPLVIGLTIVVSAIVYLEIDFFSGPLNSWLYTYHIVRLLPASDSYLDPFITFVIALTNGTIDINTGKCFWNGMTTLQKHTLQYLMPFYCMALLYSINKFLRYFPNLALSRHSFHHAFVTIVIISYASLLQNTMLILQPVKIHGTFYVFISADSEYFGRDHLPYAVPASMILFLIVIPFPFIIAFNSFFTKRFYQLRNFIPLFEVLQSPYRAERTWFASYYIFCRLVFVSVMMASPEFQHTQFAFYESICVIILMTFVLLQPYNEENLFYFKVDTFFLSLLCLIYCVINAVEANKDPVSVRFFITLARILIYVPFIYSFGLLVLHARRKWGNYWLQRRQAENRPLLQ